MKLNKKSFQKFFKLFSYGIFKIIHGKIEGIIDPNKNNKNEYVTRFPVKGLDYPNNPYKQDLVFIFSSN